ALGGRRDEGAQPVVVATDRGGAVLDPAHAGARSGRFPARAHRFACAPPTSRPAPVHGMTCPPCPRAWPCARTLSVAPGAHKAREPAACQFTCSSPATVVRSPFMVHSPFGNVSRPTVERWAKIFSLRV